MCAWSLQSANMTEEETFAKVKAAEAHVNAAKSQ